jgi:hypothetical protein
VFTQEQTHNLEGNTVFSQPCRNLTASNRELDAHRNLFWSEILMKTNTMIALFLGGMSLAACSVDPQAAQARRDAINLTVFPDPADRQGIEMTFPLESAGVYRTLEVVWRPEQVSFSEVTRRVQGFCLRQNSDWLTGQVGLKTEVKDGSWNHPSEGVVPIKSAFFRCL